MINIFSYSFIVFEMIIMFFLSQRIISFYKIIKERKNLEKSNQYINSYRTQKHSTSPKRVIFHRYYTSQNKNNSKASIQLLPFDMQKFTLFSDYRQNKNYAVMTIIPIGEIWKVENIDVIDEARIL